MKIFSQRFFKFVLVWLGLFAVLLAYRSGQQSNNQFTGLDSDFAADIRVSPVTPPEEEVPAPVPAFVQAEAVALPANDISSVDEYPETTFSTDFANAGLNLELPVAEASFESTPEVSVDMAPEANFDFPMEVEEESEPVVELADADDASQESLIETKLTDTPSETVNYVESVPTEALGVAAPPVMVSEAAAVQAVHRIEYGKALARRNATEAAGQEFIAALRILAESNDHAAGGIAHMTALRNGLRALEEAGDFRDVDPQRQIAMDVATVAEGHETQIFGPGEAEMLTPSSACRRYLEFAGKMLGQCGGQNAVASEALYCLGKMRTITAQSNPDPESRELLEAISFQQAALTADPANYRSCNELGVLLARNGQLDAAETHLKNSLRIKQTPQGWSNLAKVHQRKGTPQDLHLAKLAMNEYHVAMHKQTSNVMTGPIVLVDPKEFVARSAAPGPEDGPQMSVNPTPTPVVPVNSEVEEKPSSLVEYLSSKFKPKAKYR